MKNKIILAFLLPALCMTLPACAKKADPVALPPVDEISTVIISENETVEQHTDKEWIESLVAAVAKARPTNKASVNDFPDVGQYVKIEVNYDGGTDILFLYEDSGKYYLEQPYQGIYYIDASMSEMIRTKSLTADTGVTAVTGMAGADAPDEDPQPSYSGMEEAPMAETVEYQEVEIILTEGETVDREAVSRAALEERLINAISEMLTAETVSVQLSDEGALISIKVGDGVMPTERQQDAVKKLVEQAVTGLSPDRISLEIEAPQQSKGEPARLTKFPV